MAGRNTLPSKRENSRATFHVLLQRHSQQIRHLLSEIAIAKPIDEMLE